MKFDSLRQGEHNVLEACKEAIQTQSTRVYMFRMDAQPLSGYLTRWSVA